jgi:hypothetical protein
LREQQKKNIKTIVTAKGFWRFKFSMILLVVLLCGSVVAQKRPAPAKDDNASGWKEFSSAEGQFTVSLPGTPNADIATVGTPVGPLRSHFLVLETGKFLYYVSYVDLPAGPQTPEENTDLFEKTSAKFFDSFKLTK